MELCRPLKWSLGVSGKELGLRRLGCSANKKQKAGGAQE